jgi:hypothetical protein
MFEFGHDKRLASHIDIFDDLAHILIQKFRVCANETIRNPKILEE